MKYIPLLFVSALLLSSGHAPSSYDKSVVEISTLTVASEPYGVVKLRRSGNRVKVKYFAYKNERGTVGERFRTWAANKNIITYSSGTYMDNCNAFVSSPVGLCIDQGIPVNETLIQDDLDGLVIVYATGGIVASNLDEGNLTVTNANGTKKTLNIRNSAYDLGEFKSWAEENEATVFQTHLFAYKNQFLIKAKASTTAQPRRFLAVCRTAKGDVINYVINLSVPSSILDGGKKAFKYLQEIEDVHEITFMINLDTGCQDVFKLYSADGTEFVNRSFAGDHRISLSDASNILAYYYE